MSYTSIIERIARNQYLRHINYALIAALVLASLLAARETIKLLAGTPGQRPGLSDAGNEPGISNAAGPPGRPKKLSHYADAIEKNVFGIKGQTLSAITREQLNADSSAEKQSAQAAPSVTFKLMGTVAWSDASGYAFVIESGSEQKLYKNGQDIPGAGTLKEVYPESVVMDFGGSSYEVEIESFTGKKPAAAGAQPSRRPRGGRKPAVARAGKDFSQFARRTGENEYVVNKRAIDESIQNPQNVLTDARLLPNMAGGAQNGFRISEIKRGGLYETLGLQNGDILLSVNDFKLASPESALQAFTTLQGSSAIKLDVERRGKKLKLKYNIR